MHSSTPDAGAVRLHPEAKAAILAAAGAAAPGECCGMLIGRPASAAQPAEIVAAAPGDNLEGGRSSRRFRLAPDSVIGASRQARAKGLDLIGFYHSHPRGLARPSGEDIDEASAWAGYLHLIAAPNDPAHVRAFATGTGRWHELELLGV